MLASRRRGNMLRTNAKDECPTRSEDCLGYPMPLILRVNMILTSLSKDYDQFMQNYNMHGMGGKGKSKLAYDPKHIIPSPAKKEHPELKKNKASASGTSGNFTIELFSFPKSNTEIYDTGYGTHICNTIQGFKGYRKLKRIFGISDARILNMVQTKKVNKTPYEIWHKKVPNLSYLKVWDCEVLVKRDTPNKLESRSIKCIFVGYPKETMESSRSTIDFDEIQSEDAQPSENTSLHQHEVEPDTVEPQTDVILVCRSTRISQAPERYGFYIDAEEHELGDHGEPPNYRAALSDPESKKWLEAMNAKMQSMKDNLVWNLVDLPPNCMTVGSKWLFKKKTDIDGNIHTYEARLVAKGFIQTYGVDYEETFLPVADIKAI
ncbi:retrotransposon protein, putative, ty1-copia subclass [Tanacetum coccineum]